MFSQCILHIGTEKTGTTTLQNFLAANRSALRRSGYVFPSTIGMPGNRHLVTYALNDDRPDGIRSKLRIATAADLEHHRRKVREKLLHEAAKAADGSVLLLSSEHCHSRLVSEEEVRRLHSLLASMCRQFSVKVYLRPQHELAISHYSTFLRAGYSGTPVLPAATSAMPYYDYQQLLDRWARVFGEANVVARIYCRKELLHGDICADFLHQLGLDASSFIRTPDSNRALSGEAQALLDKLNPHLPESERGSVVRRLEEIGTAPGARPSRAEVEQFLGLFAKSNEAVRKRWFPDRDRLFDVDLSAFPEKPFLPILSEDEAAALLASLWQEKRPTPAPEATASAPAARRVGYAMNDPEPDGAGPMEACNFIVCTTQRSGKTWLVRTLECLGTGGAQEYVTMLHRHNAMLVEAWNSGGLAGFVEAFLGQQAKRPAGLSVPWNELAWMARHSGSSEATLLDRLAELMGRDTKLLFLVRRDIVAQAVSHYLLRQTGYAHSFNSEESRQSRSTVQYDAQQISRYLSLSQTAYQAWQALLKDRAHCIVQYEQLTADTVNEVRRLLTYIRFGRDLSDARIASCAGRTRKVGDGLNEAMIARFLSEPDCQATIAEARKLMS